MLHSFPQKNCNHAPSPRGTFDMSLSVAYFSSKNNNDNNVFIQNESASEPFNIQN